MIVTCSNLGCLPGFFLDVFVNCGDFSVLLLCLVYFIAVLTTPLPFIQEGTMYIGLPLMVWLFLWHRPSPCGKQSLCLCLPHGLRQRHKKLAFKKFAIGFCGKPDVKLGKRGPPNFLSMDPRSSSCTTWFHRRIQWTNTVAAEMRLNQVCKC